jgi:hypothetical protein
MGEEEDSREQLPRILVHNIRGLKVRRHVSPARSSARDIYRITRSVRRSIRGVRVSFTIFGDHTALYSTKLKGRRPSTPLPIARGAEMHYRATDFAAHLLTGNKHRQFSLRALTAFGSELLTLEITAEERDRALPKHVTIHFFLKDSLVPKELTARAPIWNPDGRWELDFGNRALIPSVRNCIFVQKETNLEFIAVRKVEKHVVEVDAVPVISPLGVFGIVIALFEAHL